MKDFLGNELAVGQEVVVCHRESKHTANLRTSRVVGFTEQMVRIEHQNWRGATTKLTDPGKLVLLVRGTASSQPPQKAFVVWCEWDIGQEGQVFTERFAAEAWCRNNRNLKELMIDHEADRWEDFIHRGLLSINEQEVS